MGAVWGVVSGKFAMTAAGLLIAARIDQSRLPALIDPQVATSAIAPDFALQRHLITTPDARATTNRRPMSIGIGAEEFDQASLTVSPTFLPSGAKMVIGRDILQAHVFALDIPRRELSLLEKGEVSRLPGHFTPVPLSFGDDGQLRATISVNGLSTQAALSLDRAEPLEIGAGLWQSLPSPPNQDAMLGFGHLLISTPFTSAPASGAAPVILGLNVFRGRTIVLDLPHNRLWIGPAATNG
jgi:hypothetical protein